MLERTIIIGLIVSTEFNQRMKQKWTPNLFDSPTAKRIATWVKEYFEKYGKAPGKDIEPIFYEKAKNGLPKDLAEEIEEEILPSLSKQYEDENINLEYLVEKSTEYFNERALLRHSEEIKALVEDGKISEATAKASSYRPMTSDMGSWIDLSDETIMEEKIKTAFNRSTEPLIRYPRDLGKFWNQQLVRGGFVALFGPEKRGKSFIMLDFAMRARRQGRKVAFFQAGDMSESEQLKRICIYLARKSNKAEYCEEHFEPVRDCIYHQLDMCSRKDREYDCSNLFNGLSKNLEKITADNIRKTVSFEHLKESFEKNAEHKTCTNCKHFKGTVWFRKISRTEPIDEVDAYMHLQNFFIKHKRSFRISTHANGTLSVKESESILDIWEKQDNFIPDVILYDYPDIMKGQSIENRHKQNEIWMDLRAVSQKRKALVIAVTQSDAPSYEKDIVSMSNFSEDKRKYGHVTAFYGLNQDHNGREKKIGVMRINEIVVREGAFDTSNQVYVLQNLRRGIPFLTSFL